MKKQTHWWLVVDKDTGEAVARPFCTRAAAHENNKATRAFLAFMPQRLVRDCKIIKVVDVASMPNTKT